MKILCVYPPFPKTYWGAEYTRPITRKKSLFPPLGLLTVAGMLPYDWDVKLCDMNIRPLEPDDLAWADAVFLSGMLVQRDALHELARRVRAAGVPVVVGGPYVSSCPDAMAGEVDCVVLGEAEELMPRLVAALESGTLPARLVAAQRPELGLTPVPRFDLIDPNHYNSIGLQYSRGCPFDCEFCDIIELFGRKPRHKEPAQFLRELDALFATGYRGSVFVVDDNFIGNRAQTRMLLHSLAPWMREHADPYDLYTEASVNLAADDELVEEMVSAGFSAVFLGIETPSIEALRAAHKMQNTAIEMAAGVRKLAARGLDVMGGFILGFDCDDGAAIERLRQWIAVSPIPLAMAGLLIALPGTRLERRLRAEGRLLEDSGGDNFARTNFRTTLAEPVLLESFARLLEGLYEPEAYFDRAARALELMPRPCSRYRVAWRFGLVCLAGSLLRQGLLGFYRRAYWRFLWRALRRAPLRITDAVRYAIQGEHMIRYTHQDVLPRLRLAIREAQLSDRAVQGQAEQVLHVWAS